MSKSTKSAPSTRPRLLQMIEEARPYAERLVYQEGILNSAAATDQDCIDGNLDVTGEWCKHAMDPKHHEMWGIIEGNLYDAMAAGRDAGYVLGIAVGKLLRADQAPLTTAARVADQREDRASREHTPSGSDLRSKMLHRMAVELSCDPEEVPEKLRTETSFVVGVLSAVDTLATVDIPEDTGERLGDLHDVILDALGRARMVQIVSSSLLWYLEPALADVAGVQ